MYRYVAIALNSSSPDAANAYKSMRNRILADHEWTTCNEGCNYLIAAVAMGRSSGRLLRLAPQNGAIVGTLFGRSGSPSFAPVVEDFDARQSRAIVESGGQYIVENYWGSYVAMIHDPAALTHHVFRGPNGNLPCYHARHNDIDIFFSHLEDCSRLFAIRLSVKRKYLALWLTFSELSTRETGLDNVDEMPSGERLSLSRGRSCRSLIWNPVQIAKTGRFERAPEAAEAVRSTVQEVVDAWAHCYERIVVKLSGGLDSSIVAGCLARTPSRPSVSFLNFAIDVKFVEDRPNLSNSEPARCKLAAMTGTGDERHFARLVAKQWSIPLMERSRDCGMDLKRLWEAPLKVAPAQYFTVMEVDDAEVELARTRGVQAFFSGQAGDSVLQLMTEPLSAIDYAWLRGFNRELGQHMLAAAKLSRQSFWRVLGRTIKHGFLHVPYHQAESAFLNQPTLLRDEILDELNEHDFENAWRRAASLLPPGKQDHITGLAGSGYHNFIFRGGAHADYVDPLDSQPLWETMLQIPTYTILTGGVSRGLARMAFADVLPTEIRRRQAKGAGSSFYKTVVRTNREFLFDVLRDGYLVRDGYLDRRKLDEYFLASNSPGAVSPSQLLNYVAAEVWLQQCAQSNDAIRASRFAQSG